MNRISSMNTNNTNFHSSDNDTVEPPIDRTRTLSGSKRKRILKAIVFIVVILLVVVSIVVPTTILLTRETYTVDNATTATSTPTKSATATATSTPTTSATVTATSTPTTSATATATSTPTTSATAAATSTPTTSATATATSTPTTSATATATSTPTTSATATATSTPTTSATTTVTTDIAGLASTACTSNTDKSLFNNEFIYSPTSQMYAAGLLNNQFGIYKAYGYENVTSSAIWLANQYSVPGNELKLQRDRNLMVYGNGGSIWGSNTHNGGAGLPFCLKLLDSGNLLWIDKDETILWQPTLDSLFNVL